MNRKIREKQVPVIDRIDYIDTTTYQVDRDDETRIHIVACHLFPLVCTQADTKLMVECADQSKSCFYMAVWPILYSVQSRPSSRYTYIANKRKIQQQ